MYDCFLTCYLKLIPGPIIKGICKVSSYINLDENVNIRVLHIGFGKNTYHTFCFASAETKTLLFSLQLAL